MSFENLLTLIRNSLKIVKIYTCIFTGVLPRLAVDTSLRFQPLHQYICVNDFLQTTMSTFQLATYEKYYFTGRQNDNECLFKC
jgi:hypothetical protein